MRFLIASLACAYIITTSLPAFAYVSRDHMYRFCEHKNTMDVAEIGMKAIWQLGDDQGSAYYRSVIKKVYERTSNDEWTWIALAHDRILESLIYYKDREGRYMTELDKPFIMDSCKLAIPGR
jgi:hypothetical protein